MAVIAPSVGDSLMLQYLLNVVGTDGGTPPANGNRLLKLYTNNYSPNKSSLLGNFTEASLSSGYAPILLNGANWTITIGPAGASGVYPQQVFTFTSGVTIYGYYITTFDGLGLLWAEVFSPTPYVLPSGGGQIAIDLNIGFN